MRARLRLLIHKRVEIRIVEDDGVRGGEVEPEPARARGHQHEKRARVRRVERLDQSLALRRRRGAVDAAVVELRIDAATAAAAAFDGGEAHAAESKPVLEDVEHARHLAEEQHAVPPGAKFREEFREELHLRGGGSEEDGVERPRRNRPEFRTSLARGGEILLLRRRRRDVLGQARFPRRSERVLLCRRKQKRMVAHLLQLFEDVEQRRALRRAHAVIHGAVILRQHVRVHLALKRRQLARHLHLSLLRQTLQHVLLQSAEHVLGQQRVEIAELSFGVRGCLLVLGYHLGVGGERLGQARGVLKLRGVQKVQQREELLKVILQRRSRQQTPERRVQTRERLTQLGLVIFQSVALVDDDRAPFEIAKRVGVRHGRLVVGEHDVQVRAARRDAPSALARPRARTLTRRRLRKLVHSKCLPRRLVSDVRHAVQTGTPRFELARPVGHRRQRRHHQRGPAEETQRARRVHENSRLDRLPETHLVAEDGASTAPELIEHPQHALALILVQGEPARVQIRGAGGVRSAVELSPPRAPRLFSRGERRRLGFSPVRGGVHAVSGPRALEQMFEIFKRQSARRAASSRLGRGFRRRRIPRGAREKRRQLRRQLRRDIGVSVTLRLSLARGVQRLRVHLVARVVRFPQPLDDGAPGGGGVRGTSRRRRRRSRLRRFPRRPRVFARRPFFLVSSLRRLGRRRDGRLGRVLFGLPGGLVVPEAVPLDEHLAGLDGDDALGAEVLLGKVLAHLRVLK